MSKAYKPTKNGLSKLRCVACDENNPVEHVHDLLRVPLCGVCNHSYKRADFSFTEQYCMLCANGDDGRELFLCDTCPNSFCVECIARNFGLDESAYVREANPWSCYFCNPTPAFNKLKVTDDIQFFNMESMYESIKPPKYSTAIDEELINSLSPGERALASIFVSGIATSQFLDINIYREYLVAKDVFGKLFCVSKKLRELFKRQIFTPGMFKTTYGEENNCQLYPHQVTGLHRMKEMESGGHRQSGKLRGGIIADAPGLGKTVTMLALISSTLGQFSDVSGIVHHNSSIDEMWSHFRNSGNLAGLLLPIINNVGKVIGKTAQMKQLLSRASANIVRFESIREFEVDLRKAIHEAPGANGTLKHSALSSLRKDLLDLKDSLDSRPEATDAFGNVIAAIDRPPRLKPSTTTLLIVPLALLEHWIEQISRHWGLRYMSDNGDDSNAPGQGVVYIDGFGDIQNIQFPLPRLQLMQELDISPIILSSYSVFITTFERCASLQKLRIALDDGMNGTGQSDRHSLDSLNLNSTMLTKPRKHKKEKGSTQAGNDNLSVAGNESVQDLASVTSGNDRDKEESRSKKLRANKSMFANTSLKQFATQSVRTLETFTGIKWLRIVIDEGHELGLNSKKDEDIESSIVQYLSSGFIGDLSSDFRWVISGTPTVGAVMTDSLDMLHNILVFLRHPIFGLRPIVKWNGESAKDSNSGKKSNVGKKSLAEEVPQAQIQMSTPPSGRVLRAKRKSLGQYSELINEQKAEDTEMLMARCKSLWQDKIVDPLLRQDVDVWMYLQSLLKSVMIRHSKSDLKLFDPIFSTIVLDPILPSDESFFENLITDRLNDDNTASNRNLNIPLNGANNTGVSQAQVSHEEGSGHNTRKRTINSNRLNTGNTSIVSLSTSMNTTSNSNTNPVSFSSAPSNIAYESVMDEIESIGRESSIDSQISTTSIDRAMARFIADTMYEEREKYQLRKYASNNHIRNISVTPNDVDNNRRPKAIVFSQFHNDLQGVGHFLYLDSRFGDKSVCEHFGMYRSNELSRFRHSKRKCRVCPLCGHENSLVAGDCCEKLLVLVEYIPGEWNVIDGAEAPYPPSPGGHGGLGPGGPFLGNCLCSPTGCTNNCRRMPNGLGAHLLDLYNVGMNHVLNNHDIRHNLALVAEDHIVGYTLGRQWHTNEMVTVSHQAYDPTNDPYIPEGSASKAPLLWCRGRLGGRAVVRGWKRCGGNARRFAWHPGPLLRNAPWTHIPEDCTLLLLHEDGTHGLDLSFVTHIFLLEQCSDPALLNQVISRAHRMGATGPVKVMLLQVNSLNQAPDLRFIDLYNEQKQSSESSTR